MTQLPVARTDDYNQSNFTRYLTIRIPFQYSWFKLAGVVNNTIYGITEEIITLEMISFEDKLTELVNPVSLGSIG